MMASACHTCNAAVNCLLDFGSQPICNHFLVRPDAPEITVPLRIGQCSACGLVQLNDLIPVDNIRAPWDWIVYNEPEGHLEELVERVSALPGITLHSQIGGIVFGGDTTIARFEKKGFSKTWRIDLKRDLGVTDATAGVETLQQRLTPEAAERIVRDQGEFDVIIIRHVLEHTQNTRGFLKTIQTLLKPEGFAVFEVPDCEKAFATCDYSILWEEHTSYFMPETLQYTLRFFGFDQLSLWRPLYSLVAFTQPNASHSSQMLSLSGHVLASEQKRFEHFAASFPTRREKVQALVTNLVSDGKMALFGAGHLACVYINLLELKDKIECVIDDHPRKKGLYMPGSRLPILSSAALIDLNIKTCLSALSPETEQNILKNNPGFVAAGGRFMSIFAGRPNSILS
jgi:hypothetical protein